MTQQDGAMATRPRMRAQAATRGQSVTSSANGDMRPPASSPPRIRVCPAPRARAAPTGGVLCHRRKQSAPRESFPARRACGGWGGHRNCWRGDHIFIDAEQCGAYNKDPYDPNDPATNLHYCGPRNWKKLFTWAQQRVSAWSAMCHDPAKLCELCCVMRSQRYSGHLEPSVRRYPGFL